MDESLLNWYLFIKDPMNVTQDRILGAILNKKHSLGTRFTTQKGEVYVYCIYMGNSSASIGDKSYVNQENYQVVPVYDESLSSNSVFALNTKPNTFTFVRLDLPGVDGSFNAAFLQHEIEDLQKNKSDKYRINFSRMLAGVAEGTSLTGSYIDFSGITYESLGLNELEAYSLFCSRGTKIDKNISYTLNYVALLSMPYGLAVEDVECWVNGAMFQIQGERMFSGGIKVFSVDKYTKQITWNEAFETDKVASILQCSPYEEFTKVFANDFTLTEPLSVTLKVYLYGNKPTSKRKATTVSDGDIEVEDLFNTTEEIVQDMAETDLEISNVEDSFYELANEVDEVKLTKSDIYHPDYTEWQPIKYLKVGDDVLKSQIDLNGIDSIIFDGREDIDFRVLRGDHHSYYIGFYLKTDNKANLVLNGDNEGENGVIAGHFDLSDLGTGWHWNTLFTDEYPDKIYSFDTLNVYPDETLISDIFPPAEDRGPIFDAIRGRFSIQASVDCEWLYHNTATGGTGTSNYNVLDNKPSINGVTLRGNKTASNLGLITQVELDKKSDIYLIDDTIKISNVQIGYNLQNSVWDFSQITPAMFVNRGSSDYIMIVRFLPQDEGDVDLRLWCSYGRDQGDVDLFRFMIDSCFHMDTGAMTGYEIFTVELRSGLFTWNPQFIQDHADKKITMTITGRPDKVHAELMSFQSNFSLDIGERILVTSGAGSLYVDCKFLHNQMQSVTAIAGDLENRLEFLTTDDVGLSNEIIDRQGNLTQYLNVMNSDISYRSYIYQKGNYQLSLWNAPIGTLIDKDAAIIFNLPYKADGGVVLDAFYAKGQMENGILVYLWEFEDTGTVMEFSVWTGPQVASKTLCFSVDKATRIITLNIPVNSIKFTYTDTDKCGITVNTATMTGVGQYCTLYSRTEVDCEWLYNNTLVGLSYNNLNDKPQIQGITLVGNKTYDEMNIAQASKLDALVLVVDAKADQSDLDATNAAVATKANQTDLTATNAVVATKASQADLDATNTVVASKASQADLDATNTIINTLTTRIEALESKIPDADGPDGDYVLSAGVSPTEVKKK